MSNSWDTDDDSGDWAGEGPPQPTAQSAAPAGARGPGPVPAQQHAATQAKKPLISMSGPTFLMVLGVGAMGWWAWNNSKKTKKKS